MSEPDHVAVMKRAKELCAQDGFVWWELPHKAEPSPFQQLVNDNRRQEYMSRARDQLRRERRATAETLHNSTEPVPATPAAPHGDQGRARDSRSSGAGSAPDAGVRKLVQTHISGRLRHGEALPPRSALPGGLPSRIARAARWMAPSGGLALLGLAAWLTLHLPPADRSLPGDTPAAVLQAVLSPRLAPPIGPGLPAGVTEARLEQVEAAPAPITRAKAGPAEHKAARRRKLDHRSRFIAVRALVAHPWTPVFADRCPYQCSWAEAMRGGDD